jgi:hypothetical protein
LWSVAGSAVKAWLGTWQVPQAWTPEAERLVSKKIALPATLAADCAAGAGAGVSSAPLPPPQPDSAPAASSAAA